MLPSVDTLEAFVLGTSSTDTSLDSSDSNLDVSELGMGTLPPHALNVIKDGPDTPADISFSWQRIWEFADL